MRKVVESLPAQSDFELFTEEEERVSFEDEMNDKFEVTNAFLIMCARVFLCACLSSTVLLCDCVIV